VRSSLCHPVLILAHALGGRWRCTRGGGARGREVRRIQSWLGLETFRRGVCGERAERDTPQLQVFPGSFLGARAHSWWRLSNGQSPQLRPPSSRRSWFPLAGICICHHLAEGAPLGPWAGWRWGGVREGVVSLVRRFQRVLKPPPRTSLFWRPELGGFEPSVLAAEGVGPGRLFSRQLALAVLPVCKSRGLKTLQSFNFPQEMVEA
jgi:hypothetical protein